MQQEHQPIRPTQHSECLLTKSFQFLKNNQTIENFQVYNNKQIRSQTTEAVVRLKTNRTYWN